MLIAAKSNKIKVYKIRNYLLIALTHISEDNHWKCSICLLFDVSLDYSNIHIKYICMYAYIVVVVMYIQ